MDRWTDRVVLVTGASSGIGRSIVVELSKYPLKIVAVARRINLLQELSDELQSSVAKIYPVQCDLTRESEILKMFKWIETTIGQGVSVTINNAGIMIKSKMLDGETNDWRYLFDLNVIAVTTCCRESYKSMNKYGIIDGHIININSTAGYTLLPLSGQKVYNSSKTALTYLTEGLRHELAHAGSKIKVTSINPGKVNSEAVGNVGGNKKSNLSMKPERVASMVIVALTQPTDVVIGELTVLSAGETMQTYPPPIISLK
ncbi:3-alpha-(or 20-beta)-hydroxysteroid dehydrogenase-like [Acyrthosiphon pisum]|uniref:ACYPI002007 protein n=1 Tax=Acyrthosiphon pisum TaxID=7029 RepID=C4WWP4_ACYPI|nr:3-alpha-(or 20-beta)-hydroxysteroid dehydrogenase-like [Acyrthosiphon pisum]BAH72314.1 ACYPI002007 [Acyrthosiphon pisum]|eukprot:NP_001156094.1 3-alpha-(or 20-beta)-hydroxysteroid dehydrogenase-like [Acyrthosiphon pisum]